MLTTVNEAPYVAKKKPTPDPKAKRYGTLVRVSDEFADALRRVALFEGISQTLIADTILLPVLEKRYKDAVVKEARRVEGKN